MWTRNSVSHAPSTIQGHADAVRSYSAPFTLYCPLEVFLGLVKLQQATVSTKDIIIFLKSSEQHPKYIEDGLRFLKEEGITVKLKKCFIFRKTTDYSEYLIFQGN